MQLYTWHTPGYSLLTGRVDHGRSYYVNVVDGLAEVYAELFRRLGTDQIVWCQTTGEDIPSQDPRIGWILRVPDDQIIRFLDELVWDRIRTGSASMPYEQQWRLRMSANEQWPYDRDRQEQYVKEELERFGTLQPPAGTTWWDHLFVPPQAAEAITAIIPHPVRPEWVLLNPNVPPRPRTRR